MTPLFIFCFLFILSKVTSFSFYYFSFLLKGSIVLCDVMIIEIESV